MTWCSQYCASPRRATDRVVVILGALLILCAVAPRWARADEQLQFNIEAGPAINRLHEFAGQSHMQVLFDMRVVRKYTTRPIAGTMMPEQALTSLLGGTHLQYYRIDAKTWTVEAPADERSKKTAEDVMTVQPKTVVIRPPWMDEVKSGARRFTLGSADIDSTGYATLGEVLSTLPQNFGGGPSDDIRQRGPETPTNSGKGESFNLRGVGAHATVVLINGRRIAPSGSEGAFVDVSNIPMTAVSSIHILPQSDSAQYGSDGMGGVVDIHLREEYSGVETQLGAGGAARGSHERQVAQTFGKTGDRGHALLSFEYYERDAFPSDARWQGSSDLSTHGGSNFDTIYANPGTIIAGGQTWAIPPNQDGTALTSASLKAGTRNLEDLLRAADLIAGQRRKSIVSSLQFALDDMTSVFADALATERHAQQKGPGVRLDLEVPASNPFYVNPTRGSDPVDVAYDFIDDLGPSTADVLVRTYNIAAGARYRLGRGWTAEIYDGWALEQETVYQNGLVDNIALAAALSNPDPATAFNPFGAGSHSNPATLAAIRTHSVFRSRSGLASFNVLSKGPLFELPSGTSELSFGLDKRFQYFKSDSSEPPDRLLQATYHDRTVTSGFSQIRIPVFKRLDSDSLLPKEMDVTLGIRGERYSDIGWVRTPTAQIGWLQSASWAAHAAWGKYASAPHLVDMDEYNNGLVLTSLPDSSAAEGSTKTLILFGKNRDLRPEWASSWSIGFDFAPQAMPGLALSTTYFYVNSYDRIQNIAFTEDLLTDPAYKGLIVRQPTAEQRADVCKHGTFYGSASDCLLAPVGAIADLRTHNGGTLRTDGIDLSVHDRINSRLGDLSLSLDGTYLLNYAQSDLPAAPLVDLLNTQNNPISLRLRGAFSWRYRDVVSRLFVNYTGGYRDVLSQPSRPVQSWMTTDLWVSLSDLTGLFQESELSLTVQNLFNKSPPFLNNSVGIGYDAENSNLLGRFVRLRFKVGLH
jgi:iron complex outermembrane receptor protein